jgi:hypothetical protein
VRVEQAAVAKHKPNGRASTRAARVPPERSTATPRATPAAPRRPGHHAKAATGRQIAAPSLPKNRRAKEVSVKKKKSGTVTKTRAKAAATAAATRGRQRQAGGRPHAGTAGRGNGGAISTRLMRIRELDPQAACGQGTTVMQLFRVDHLPGSDTAHLVFFDRHGWYCVHGRECPAVAAVRKRNTARTSRR